MGKNVITRIGLTGLMSVLLFTGFAADLHALSEVNYGTLQQTRMVETVLWSTPLTATWYFRDAYFNEAGADYNDVVYFSRPMEPNTQWLTPNQQSLYSSGILNLEKDGPVVVDLPATEEIVLFGSFIDAWQIPLEDIGPAGADKGEGGKYIVVPVDYEGEIPEGCHVVESATNNIWFNFRVVPTGHSDEALAEAVEFLKQYSIYPLSEAANPAPTRFIDITDIPFDTLHNWDRTYFQVLNEITNEEMVYDKDKQMMEFMASFGINHGETFEMTEELGVQLDAAALSAFRILQEKLISEFGVPMHEGSRWMWPAIVDVANQSAYIDDVSYMTDRRSVVYFAANHAPKYLGGGTVYLVTFEDDRGELMRGEGNYRMHIPANPPAEQFWSLNIYDLETNAFIKTPSKKVGLSSLDTGLEVNEDGSVDIYFGINAPEGKENNWIPTEGRDFYPMFRYYGPTPAAFDGSYVLPDIKQLD